MYFPLLFTGSDGQSSRIKHQGVGMDGGGEGMGKWEESHLEKHRGLPMS